MNAPEHWKYSINVCISTNERRRGKIVLIAQCVAWIINANWELRMGYLCWLSMLLAYFVWNIKRWKIVLWGFCVGSKYLFCDSFVSILQRQKVSEIREMARWGFRKLGHICWVHICLFSFHGFLKKNRWFLFIVLQVDKLIKYLK